MGLTAIAEDRDVGKHPLTRAQYDLLVGAGTFEDQAVELLDGVVVEMAPQGEQHSSLTTELTHRLVRGVPEPWRVRVQMPLATTDASEPEPDIAVVVPVGVSHPTTATLVVEVATTSQRKDLLHKPAVYAAAGVEQYWVIDLPAREVVVHTDPGPGGYATVRRLPWTARLSVLGVDVDLVALLPEGPQLYPDGDITDEPEETLVAELIREAALEGVRDELPHSITVTIEEMGLREGRPEDKPLLDIYASMIVERDSQKGIIIGHRGSRLRDIGARSRAQIETLLGTPVYLDLRVKVLKEWQRDAKYLNRLGF